MRSPAIPTATDLDFIETWSENEGDVELYEPENKTE